MARADPADIAARERSAAGLAPQPKARQQAPPHPSHGGSTGYPVSQREQALARSQQGQCLPTAISRSSIDPNRVNGVHPKGAAGISESQVLFGASQFAMAMVLHVYPEATGDEVAAFIHANTGEVLSRTQVSKRMRELKLSSKQASPEACQAFSPGNRLRDQWFYSMPPPLGVVTLRRKQLIDVGECAVTLEKVNRSTGHDYTGGQKITLLMAIEPGDPALPANVEGSVANPRRWFATHLEPGTNQWRFADFCNTVCTSCENSGLAVDADRVFLWDNLAAHGAPVVYQTVVGRALPQRFRILPRPPYMPKYGPIEYAFCEVIARLKLLSRPDWNVQQLEQAIHQTCAAIGRNGGFENTFAHCGYQVVS
ncbi:hypothetical protein MPSEU_000304300 [Mayamaea pseudoterrestris]|nr:hypothetical protein MPSEU_000304300 [Mayamaea pseudoterrestris]